MLTEPADEPQFAPDAMSGLSIWLRYQAETLDAAPWRLDPQVVQHVATLRAWADEVEAARKAREVATEVEMWLRTVCFQKPTPEAYDLAKCAWEAACKVMADRRAGGAS